MSEASSGSPSEPTSGPTPPRPRPRVTAPLYPRRLHRSSTDRRIGGVAGGIAEYGDWDPVVVRVIMAAVIFFTGIGFFFYLAAWVIVPVGTSQGPGIAAPGRYRASSGDVLDDESRMRTVIGLVVLAALIGIATGSWAALGLGLIGGGIWLLSQSPDDQAPATYPTHAATASWEPPSDSGFGSSTTTAPPPTAAPAHWQSQYEYEAHRYGWPDLADVAPTEAAAGEIARSRPVAPRQRQTITRITLAGLLLLAALAFAASTGGWWDVSYQRMLGIGLTIIGTGVALGALVGSRARGLIPLGILGAVLLLPVSAVDEFIDDGVGAVRFQPASLDELQTSYELGFGEMVLDLSAIDMDDTAREVNVSLGAGDLVVLLPPDASGTARIDMEAGDLVVKVPNFRGGLYEADGLNVDAGPITLAGDDGPLLLDIEIEVGAVELIQGAE